MGASRRRFLKELAGGTLALPLTTRALAARQTAPPVSASDWERVRDEFSFSEDRVPMNAANLCPSPRAVAEEVARLTADIDHDCSSQNRAKFRARLEASRQAVADGLGVSVDEIALVRNTSEANNIINNGLPLDPGDEVVVWDQNHPTNNVAWEVRAARFGLRVTKVATPATPTDAGELLEVFERALSDRTRVLALTHISNVTGIKLPVAELVEVAHRRNIHVHLDGAQSWGALDVDLRALGCDSYSASAHKWFVGPKEVGLLYVRTDQVERIWPSEIAPSWGNDVDPRPEGARKFESMGQRDDAALAALASTAELHRRLGPAAIEARVVALSTTLKEGLADAGYRLVTPMAPELSAGVCIAEVDGNAGTLVGRLYQEHGIAGAATGGLRLCPHLYNTDEHVQRAIDAARTLLV